MKRQLPKKFTAGMFLSMVCLCCSQEKAPKYQIVTLPSGRLIKLVGIDTMPGYYRVTTYEPKENRKNRSNGQDQIDDEIWAAYAPKADSEGWTFGEIVVLDNETYRGFSRDKLSSVGLIRHVTFSKSTDGKWIKGHESFSSGWFD